MKVLWFYNENHLKHPFIVIAARAMADAGHEVIIANSHEAPEDAKYKGLVSYIERIKRKSGKKPATIATVSETPAQQVPLIKSIWRNALKNRQALRKQWVNYKETKKKRLRALRALLTHVWFKPIRQTWNINPDVIIGTRTEAAFAGFILAKLKGKRFVYYPFEVMNEQGRTDNKMTYDRIMDWCESIMLKHGDAMITQNECRAEIYKMERKCRAIPTVVHNYKPKRSAAAGGKLRALLGEKAAGKKIVLYEGNLMERRWLDAVARSSLLLDDDTILVMMGDDRLGWAEANETILKKPLAYGKLIILPEVPHDELLSYVADADVGIIIYDDKTRNNYFCEPGKLSDYIAAGIPVIAPAFPTLLPMMEEYKIGACFKEGTRESVAQAIREVLAPGKTHWKPALARAANELTWENQFPAFLSALTGKAA